MNKLRIYLDNCCYGRPFDNQNDAKICDETQAKMEIQALVRHKMVELVYSTVSLREINDYPYEGNRKAILEFVETNASYYICEDKNGTIKNLTAEIMKTGLRMKDATHTAYAIMAKCDCLITTDSRLKKYRDSRIKVVNPIEFLKDWRTLQ
jgi:predicted nucleic acid-binding protein